MSFKLIVENNNEVTLKKESHEPYNLFLERVKFLILCLNNDMPLKQCISLSFVYRNKKLYNSSYNKELEELITNIESKQNDFIEPIDI